MCDPIVDPDGELKGNRSGRKGRVLERISIRRINTHWLSPLPVIPFAGQKNKKFFPL
jgi:hypothetical protein